MSSGLHKLSILVVEDNNHMAEIIKTVLRGVGVNELLYASDASSALAILRGSHVDIAIVDYNLGDMDGVDLVKLIRRAPESPSPYLTTIMLTAYAGEQIVCAARDAGVTEFCRKPVTANELLSKISNTILHPRPFVRTDSYFGPDRRRHAHTDYTGPERRVGAPPVVSAAPAG